jgi:hypothetical protein
MPKRTLAKAPVAAQEIETAEAFEDRIQKENNAQFQELRDQAQATLAAVKESRAIRSPGDWEAMFEKAKIGYQNSRFLIQQLGAERLLEPELMATLIQLRQELLTDTPKPTAADTMMADMAIIAYRNALRVQGWIGNLCLAVERELFGQAPLDQLQGHTVGKQLTEQISRLEEVLMPLLERCHRMIGRSIAHLDARRGKLAATSVTVSQAAQVNVDCAVVNKVRHPREQGASE